MKTQRGQGCICTLQKAEKLLNNLQVTLPAALEEQEHTKLRPNKEKKQIKKEPQPPERARLKEHVS